MSKKKTIVKKLDSIQNFGAMNILCTDKTGTLTEDKIVLEKYLDVYGNEDIRVLKHAFLNSYFQTGLKFRCNFTCYFSLLYFCNIRKKIYIKKYGEWI